MPPAATSSPMSKPVKGSVELAVGSLGVVVCEGQATWVTWLPWPPYVEDDELVLVPHELECEEAASAGALKAPHAITPEMMNVVNLIRILMRPPGN
jgi:hypothetical protein